MKKNNSESVLSKPSTFLPSFLLLQITHFIRKQFSIPSHLQVHQTIVEKKFRGEPDIGLKSFLFFFLLHFLPLSLFLLDIAWSEFFLSYLILPYYYCWNKEMKNFPSCGLGRNFLYFLSLELLILFFILKESL